MPANQSTPEVTRADEARRLIGKLAAADIDVSGTAAIGIMSADIIAANDWLSATRARGGDELREALVSTGETLGFLIKFIGPTREDGSARLAGMLDRDQVQSVLAAANRAALASTDMAGAGEATVTQAHRELAALLVMEEHRNEPRAEGYRSGALDYTPEVQIIARQFPAPPVEGRTSGEGWQLVPVVPTEAMLWAYQDCPYEGAEDKWAAMLVASPKATATASVRKLLERVKAAARYVPVGDGYFDPHASHVEAVDAAVDRLAATLTDSGTAATIGGERA